jgi:hypothetical protein
MIKRSILLLILFLPFFSFGQREIFTNTFLSLDNENQFNLRGYQGYYTELDSLLKKDSVFLNHKSFIGIANGVRYYTTNPGEPTYFFNEGKVFIKSNPYKKFHFQFNPSILRSNNFSTFSYEFSSYYQHKKWYVEISSERDLVGARALQVNLISNYYGLSIDYSPVKNLTLVGGYQYNYITDNNKRNFYLTRIIYTLPNEKIYFDFRTKYMRGGTWSEYYFSPESISQQQIGFGFNQDFLNSKSSLKGYLGGGIQKIDNQSMYLLVFDLKLKTKIYKNLSGESTVGIRNFNTYIYGFVDLKLKYNF